MIEIIALIAITRNIGNIVRAKGHKAAGYQWTTVGLWFLFEIIGMIIGVIITGGSENLQCLAYLFGLAGAALGGWLGYRRAKNADYAPDYPMPVIVSVPLQKSSEHEDSDIASKS